MSAKARQLKRIANVDQIDVGFTSPSFIQTVQEKVAQHYFMASTRKSGGRRFPKGITSNPIFRAIAYCQKWYHDVERLRESTVEDAVIPMEVEPTEEIKAAMEKIRRNLLDIYQSERKPELEQLIGCEFGSAAVQGNIERLQELVDLCALHKLRRLEPPVTKRYPIPWHYYVGMAACMFLVKGIVPTKKEVTKAAIQHRVVEEAALKHGVKGPIDCGPELDRLNKQLKRSRPNWTRIFRELGLGDLPSASTRPH